MTVVVVVHDDDDDDDDVVFNDVIGALFDETVAVAVAVGVVCCVLLSLIGVVDVGVVAKFVFDTTVVVVAAFAVVVIVVVAVAVVGRNAKLQKHHIQTNTITT